MSAANLFTERKTPTPPWLVTFVDLVLLLLAFFVLMFSMGRPDVARYAAMAQSYTEVFNPNATVEAAFVRSRSFITEKRERDDELVYLRTALAAAFSRSENLKNLEIRSTARGLVISLSDAVGRDGRARPELAAALFDLGGVLANIENRLVVTGLADTSAESWTGALAHASAVAEALQGAGYDRPMTTLARQIPGNAAARNVVELLIVAAEERTP